MEKIMKPYTAIDFYDIDELLSDEERQIRDTVRDFVSKEIVPIIDDHFMKDTFPKSLIPKLAELGTFGSTIQGYDCAGLNYTSYGLIMQELERGDSGLLRLSEAGAAGFAAPRARTRAPRLLARVPRLGAAGG